MNSRVSPLRSANVPSAPAALSSVRALVVPTAQMLPPAARVAFSAAAASAESQNASSYADAMAIL